MSKLRVFFLFGFSLFSLVYSDESSPNICNDFHSLPSCFYGSSNMNDVDEVVSEVKQSDKSDEKESNGMKQPDEPEEKESNGIGNDELVPWNTTFNENRIGSFVLVFDVTLKSKETWMELREVIKKIVETIEINKFERIYNVIFVPFGDEGLFSC